MEGLDGNRTEIRRSQIEESVIESLRTSKKFGDLSNEILFEVAKRGNKYALNELYNRNVSLWMCQCPVDFSGLQTAEDWEQIAMNEFYLCWADYDPSRGFKFSTFIKMMVSHAWANEINKLSAVKRKTAVLSDSEGDFAVFENLLVSEFSSYSDEGYMEQFVDRFRRYLSEEEDPSQKDTMVNLFNLRLYFGPEMSVASLAQAVRRPVSTVYVLLRKLKDHAINFGQIERGLRNGCTVFD